MVVMVAMMATVVTVMTVVTVVVIVRASEVFSTRAYCVGGVQVQAVESW